MVLPVVVALEMVAYGGWSKRQKLVGLCRCNGCYCCLRQRRWLGCWRGGKVAGDYEGGARWSTVVVVADREGEGEWWLLVFRERDRGEITSKLGEEIGGCRWVCMVLFYKLFCVFIYINFSNSSFFFLLLYAPMLPPFSFNLPSCML